MDLATIKSCATSKALGKKEKKKKTKEEGKINLINTKIDRILPSNFIH